MPLQLKTTDTVGQPGGGGGVLKIQKHLQNQSRTINSMVGLEKRLSRSTLLKTGQVLIFVGLDFLIFRCLLVAAVQGEPSEAAVWPVRATRGPACKPPAHWDTCVRPRVVTSLPNVPQAHTQAEHSVILVGEPSKAASSFFA